MLLGSLAPHDHWYRKTVGAEPTIPSLPRGNSQVPQRRQPASRTESVSTELLCLFPSKMWLGLCRHSGLKLCAVFLAALAHIPLGT